MLNIGTKNVVADNVIVINGVEVARFDDVTTQKLLDIVNGYKNGTTTMPKVSSEPKKRYEYKKDIDPKWVVEKHEGLYCIKSGIFSKQRIAKTIANRYIKELDGIETVKVPYSDGSGKSYNAWGYKTKKKADAMVQKLPKAISAEECNKLSAERG